ncbi:3'(2'),5'-bisphosphate nucleotidase [Exophiala xenobiotica]|uniref:3'(2'),5'-bisphosphate nucleotidase n=1 Tax=Exophiala xenobiotica TaxID=348802 RepID=A0A0D2BA74_9EURO|nr:3'(2'),5'-bisphosphate nucleotidase [Exophiala xenobiotica]KIW49116.1 3'(2'),5'-bisphosphate nucleotidase [Exophiala xenobiotica]
MRLSLRRILIFSCTITALIVAVVLAPRCPSSTLARLTALVSQVNSSSKSFIKPAGLGIRPLSTSTTHKTINLLSRNQTMAYEKELKIAQLAVARAAILTKAVFHEKAKGTVSKDDKSPVTIGDFGAQALIIAAIKHNFPSDEVVGEEEASSLREEKELSSKIWNLVKDVKLSDPESDALLGGPIKSEDEMLDAIDMGNSAGGNKGRIWALDPIDGTKGFLRGGQYAVCLALMVDGDVKVGVLGCPNLPVDDSTPLTEDIGAAATDTEGKGVLFSAVQGEGATSQALTRGAVTKGQPIHVSKISQVSEAVMCESVEPGHSSKGDNALIAEKLGITGKPVQMDSQAKYGSVARGAGDLYLRLPVRKDYIEKIWDHAAGDLIVREAGGQVTDVTGKRLNFSLGRTLNENKGVIATPANVHAEVLKAVQEVLAAK